MGKIIEQHISRFDGGIENDARDPRENTCRVVSNFDVLTNPRKMTPYRDSESGDSAPTTSRKQNFCIAYDGTNYNLYALGVKSGVTNAEVLYMPFSGFGSNTWTAPSANQSANTFTWFELFVYYRKTGLIYGGRGTSATAGTKIWAFSPTGTAWDDDIITTNGGTPFAFTNLGQGLVHSKDDILYIPYYNNAGAAGAKAFIAKNNGGSWNTTALTLPDYLIPTSISEYGNHLAIACKPASGIGNSRVFLWDRSETTTVLSESIDWGSGNLMILEELDGLLVGISSTIANSFVRFNSRIIFRYLVGTQAIKFKEIIGDFGQFATQLPIAKQKLDNRLYFLMGIYMAGAIRHGLWSIGRTPNAPFTLVNERTTDNNTAITTADKLKNFIIVEDYVFISYSLTDATNPTFALSKTNDQAQYTATAIYESKIFDGGNSSLKKKLLGVTIHTEFLPAAAQVVVKYKMDNETSFTTILAHDTDNAVSDSAVNIESSGAALPEFQEIQFRIEASGTTTNNSVAEVTGFSFKYEVTGKRNYD